MKKITQNSYSNTYFQKNYKNKDKLISLKIFLRINNLKNNKSKNKLIKSQNKKSAFEKLLMKKLSGFEFVKASQSNKRQKSQKYRS